MYGYGCNPYATRELYRKYPILLNCKFSMGSMWKELGFLHREKVFLW